MSQFSLLFTLRAAGGSPKGATRDERGTEWDEWRPKERPDVAAVRDRRDEGVRDAVTRERHEERDTPWARKRRKERMNEWRVSLFARFRRLSPAKGRVPRLFTTYVGSVPGDRSEPEETTWGGPKGWGRRGSVWDGGERDAGGWVGVTKGRGDPRKLRQVVRILGLEVRLNGHEI